MKKNEKAEQENLTPEKNATPEKEETSAKEESSETEFDEKAARKARMRARRLERRHKRNARIARCRTLKNFFIWLLGVFFLPLAIAASMFVIPIGIVNSISGKDIVGGTVTVDDGRERDFSKYGMYEVVTGNIFANLKIENLPVLVELFEDLKTQEIIGDRPFGEVVKIDTEKLKKVSLGGGDVGSAITDCIEVVATLGTFIDESSAADFKTLLFGDGTSFGTIGDKQTELATMDKEAKKALYYREEVAAESGDSGVTAQSEEISEETPETTKYRFYRAFDDEGNYVTELKGSDGCVNPYLELFYPPLAEVKLLDIPDVFTDIIQQTKLNDVFAVFGMSGNESEDGVVDLINKIIGKDDATIKDLGEYKFDDLKLSVFVDETEQTADLWKVLRAAVGHAGEEDYEVTLGDFDNIDIDSVTLNTFIEEGTEPNADDYDGGAASDAYKSDLQDYKNKQKFWKMLRQATGHKDDANYKVTVGDLTGGLNVDEVLLIDVINDEPEKPNNQRLWTIIETAVTDKNGDPVTKNTVTLGDLNSRLDTNKIKLSTVLKPSEYEDFYKILLEATGETSNDDVTLESFQHFNAGNIHIGTVITDTSNDLLKPLLTNNPTISGLGAAIDDLQVSEIFEDKCFVLLTKAEAGDDKTATYTYDSATETFTLDSAGEYCISKNASVWLFMYYTPSSGKSTETDTKGSAETYTKKDLKFKDMKNAVATASQSFTTATVKQLIQAGILTESSDYSKVYDKSFKDIIAIAITYMSLVP